MRTVRRILAAAADALPTFSLVCLVPIPFSLAYEPHEAFLGPVALPATVLAFVATSVIAILLWAALRFATSPGPDDELPERDAYVAVAAGWLGLTFLAALPFLLTGTLTRPVDAWFEAMSGLTATGATAIAAPQDLPASVLVWRSLLQFVAGLGIVVLSISLLIRLTHGGASLLASDPAGATTRMRPKMRETAGALWRIYAVFAAVLWAAYLAAMVYHAGMPTKDAILHATVTTFSTISAGGFAAHSENLAYYGSRAVESLAAVFMLLAGTSFALHDHARRDLRRVVRDPEWRFFAGFLAFAVIATAGILWRAGHGWTDAVWEGFFAVASIGTSTGFAITDHGAWPNLAQSMLLLLMFTGGMAGSTSGGMKMLRVMLLLKLVRRELRRLLHPRAILPVKHMGKGVNEQTLLTVIAFFFTYVTIWMGAAFLLVGLDPDLGLFDGAAAAAAAIGNTGPALGAVGPSSHYGGLGGSSKVVLAALMWIGRVEVFAALLIFRPSSWRT